MDADFVEVPRGTLVNITSSLLTVQPTDETLAVDRATSRRAIAGVARVAPQRIVLVLVDGQPANVIAFDPTQDFTVLNWLEVHQPGLISTRDLIVGDRLPGHSAKTSASAASRSAFTVGWPRGRVPPGGTRPGKIWLEVPLTPTDDGAGSVLKIEGKHTYLYVFEARVRNFAQLLPNYMHVRFSDPMLVSASKAPKGDMFERKDNYYVYFKAVRAPH